jgi:hypothetical protein
MSSKKSKKTIWTDDDESEHYPSIIEWWCIEAFFDNKNSKKKWSLKATFTEYHDKGDEGSVFFITLFDQITGKPYIYYTRNDSKKLVSSPDCLKIQYEDSNLQGKYPIYSLKLNDKTNDIKYDLVCHAISNPRWIAQEISDGWLPMGFGFYRYGFIPKCNISGTIKIKDKELPISGYAYYEHVWGDFNYDNPMAQITAIPRTLKIIKDLTKWRLRYIKPKIPDIIKLSTENNPFGYDWAWAILDNGWSIFYGNILFWLMNGPVFGTLIVTSDGKNYEEYGNIKFHYNELKYAKNYDFYYPTDFEITARKEKKCIRLRFRMTTDCHEFQSRYYYGKYWLGYIICEAPGIVEGEYSDGDQKIKLKGICRIEPQRQISILGHNEITIRFKKPPKEFGFQVDFESHFFRKKIMVSVNLIPKIRFKWNFEKIQKEIKNAPIKKQEKVFR